MNLKKTKKKNKNKATIKIKIDNENFRIKVIQSHQRIIQSGIRALIEATLIKKYNLQTKMESETTTGEKQTY